MRRIVSVWLPDWPITVFRRARRASPPPDSTPFALTLRTGRGLVLHAVDQAGQALGLRPGQSHADARAIAPGLLSAPAEPEEEARALQALALWFERFSPCVAIDPEPSGFEGLTLDMSGAAHLFGGEAALLDEITARLNRAGIPARLGLADTPGAAWALARYGQERIAGPGRARDALAALPVQALRLDGETVRLLHRLGLRGIGELYGLPRSGLARRFRGGEGLALVRRLDQALGAEAEPLRPVHPPAAYRVWQAFAEPLTLAEGVGHVLPGLAQSLTRQLERDGLGVRVLALDAFRTDGRRLRLEAGLSAPSRSATHLTRLLKEKGLERLDLGFGADALMLCALKVEPLVARQAPLPSGSPEDAAGASAENLASLIDRLQARLGEGAVRRPEPHESHLPERSERWRRAGLQAPTGPGPGADRGRPRPLLLFDPPEPVQAIAELPDAAPFSFIWRRCPHRVVKAEGPERLSPEWWRPALSSHGPDRTRDYYAVEDEAGRRFWLFREGLYGREDAALAPTWRMHGVFG
jgi:protein ImuB